MLLGALVGISPVQAASNPRHPHLGDPLKVWIAAWGKPVYSAAPTYGWDAYCPAPSIIDKYVVTFITNGAIAIITNLCNGSSPPSVAANIHAAMPFFPSDYQTRGSIKTDQGTDRLYFSANLARTAAAQEWDQDCNQVNVKRGLFTVSPNDDGAGDWQMAIGTCA